MGSRIMPAPATACTGSDTHWPADGSIVNAPEELDAPDTTAAAPAPGAFRAPKTASARIITPAPRAHPAATRPRQPATTPSITTSLCGRNRPHQPNRILAG